MRLPKKWAAARLKLVWRSFLFLGILMSVMASPASVAADLTWTAGDGCRFAAVVPEASGKSGFSRIAPVDSGLDFTNRLSAQKSLENRLLENGSGVAAGDVDGDGRCDLYFCRLEGPNALFRNLGGWRFEEVTRQAGVGCDGQFSSGAVLADVDGDSDLDLLVSSMGNGVRLFLNRGGLRFEEPFGPGLGTANGSTSLALADVDLDGDLDVYVGNYRATTVKDDPVDLSGLKLVDGRWRLPPQLKDRFVSAVDVTGRAVLHESGEPDVLMLNEAGGRFRLASWTDGRFRDEEGRSLEEAPRDWSLSVMFRDINGDRLPDLYVCSDFVQPDRFWINQGEGRFRAMPRAGLNKTSRLSMGVDFGDLNRDGLDDFFVIDMLSPSHELRMRQRGNLTAAMFTDYTEGQRPQFMRNMLYRNGGGGKFAEIARLAGLQGTDWSWSAIFLDVDLDGFEDILIGNGSMHDAQDLDVQNEIARLAAASVGRRLPYSGRGLMRALHTPNYLFRNLGRFEFAEVGREWGFASTGIANGMALADLDLDGDLDVIVNSLNSGCELYRNESDAGRVAVRLRGRGGNTRGIGARIRVRSGGIEQSQEMICGGRYLSGDEPVRVFACPGSADSVQIEVLWPGGTVSTIGEARVNRIYEIAEAGAVEGSPGSASEPTEPSPAPWFAERPRLLRHRHVESRFDDGDVQSLLDRQYSRQGPGMLAVDLDQDGWGDLVIGNGAGEAPDLFLNGQGRGFERIEGAVSSSLFPGDQTAWAVYPDESGGAVELICAVSNYENRIGVTNSVLRFRYSDRRLIPLESLPGWGDAVETLAVGDVDGDGKADLFAGGRMRPGRYPEPASSRLYLRRNGVFVEDNGNAEVMNGVGLVTGAAFADFDGDGWLDLVCAREWGAIRVFLNRGGKLVAAGESWGLESFAGLWTGVVVGDFDGDGRADLVAGNWGRNTPHQVDLGRPIGIVFGDLGSGGSFVHAKTHFSTELGREVPYRDRDSLAEGLPSVMDRFPSHAEFGRAGISDVLGEGWLKTRRLEARTLDSMVFLNRGGRFEAVRLPLEAQMAPCFGIGVADFNGDGRSDLFLNQNFSFTEIETAPFNDGWGAVLMGDGKGGFRALSPDVSGIFLPGDGRGCVVMDWNRDGQMDLVVGQNNQGTRLMLNSAPKVSRRE
ncbi:MAG: VCBS repeat-containing protein [Verrucomicrobia bacterium]|nr:VCBS repeat-containing protein [Verrucomicrobiota bacterium]